MTEGIKKIDDALAGALDRLTQIAAEDSDVSFRKLVEAGGLDPSKDFVGASLRELDLRDEDLRGFDFSFADLEGADFRRARIGGARFIGAALTGAIGLPAPLSPEAERALRPGDEFIEDPNGPVMRVIPAGSFRMGSPEGEGRDSEHPQHEVTFARPLAIGKYAVTVDEFAAFVAETGHDTGNSAVVWNGSAWNLTEGRSWRDPGFPQTGRHPVTCVNWEDATAYAKWLWAKTGQFYRLPSEAEWEYAARAGTTGDYWTGQTISPQEANFAQNNGGTVPVDIYAANPFGLYNVYGNVWEWVEDFWNSSYWGAPVDGSARTSGDRSRRVFRGGSWFYNAEFLRAFFRVWGSPRSRITDTGFRLVRTLNT